MRIIGLLALTVSISLSAFAQDSDPVRVYPAAPGEPLSKELTVAVGTEHTSVPVYLATVLAMDTTKRLKTDRVHFDPGDVAQSSFASFDLRGEAPVQVTYSGTVQSAKILPTSSGITPQVSGNTITFTVSKPGQYVLEINGDWARSLQVFANPWEADAPDPHDPNVIYYGPGIHKVTSVKVGSGKTVYLAADAVVYGQMGGSGCTFDVKGDNVTVRGRGIIDGSLCPHEGRRMLRLEGHHITVRDIILRDSGAWNMPVEGADGVTIDNVKIIGYRANADGIDVNGSQNVHIQNCYLRTDDDLVTIKSKDPQKGETRNVTVEHCVLWNELAQGLIVGGEMQRPVDNIRFADCDVIHDKGRCPLLHVAQCDAAPVTHITFENLRIEECQHFITLWIGTSMWGHDPERGHIDDVVFRNIATVQPRSFWNDGDFLVSLKGLDAEHAIHNVTFDHITVDGKPLPLSEIGSNRFADGITVTP